MQQVARQQCPGFTSIGGISVERMTDGRQVRPDLMAHAGLDANLEQRAVRRRPRARGRRSGPAGPAHRARFARAGSGCRDRRGNLDAPLGTLEPPVDQPEVDLLDLSPAELSAQGAETLGCPRREIRPRGLAIEPVAEPRLARRLACPEAFGVAGNERIGEGAQLARPQGMAWDASRLVEHY